MSVIGISPTDISKGVQVLKKGVTALGSGPSGARQQYREADAASTSLERAIADLSTSVDSTTEATTVYNAVLDRERRLQTTLQPYRATLGRNNSTNGVTAVKRKLQYAFDGASKVREHLSGGAPLIVAALFQTLGLQNEQSIKHHQDTSQLICNSTTSITDKIDGLAPEIAIQLAAKDSDAFKSALASYWEQIKLDLEPLVQQAVRDSIGNIAGPPADLSQASRHTGTLSTQLMVDQNSRAESRRKADLRARTSLFQKEQKSQSRIPPSAIAVKERCGQQLSALSYYQQQRALSDLLRTFGHFTTYKFMLSLVGLSITALYHNPAAWRVVASSLHTYHRDPLSLTLLLLMAWTFANCCSSLPAQLSLLTDESIYVDTALGEPLKVPRCYWESFDIFHGFLVTHFKTRPGNTYVNARRYRILLGGATGQVLEIAKWPKVVSARMKLVMALLLFDLSDTCPKCGCTLLPHEDSLSYCENCDKLYQFVETGDGMGRATDLDSHLEEELSESAMPFLNSALGGTGSTRNQRALDTASNGTVSAARLDELQYFVHMLLAKNIDSAAHSGPFHGSVPSESSTPTTSAADGHNGPSEDLVQVVEELRVCVRDWFGLEVHKFGACHFHDECKVSTDRQSWQTLKFYLFGMIIILVKPDIKDASPVMTNDGRELARLKLKGSILVKHVEQVEMMPGDLILTLKLSVDKLPQLHIKAPGMDQLQMWYTAIMIYTSLGTYVTDIHTSPARIRY